MTGTQTLRWRPLLGSIAEVAIVVGMLAVAISNATATTIVFLCALGLTWLMVPPVAYLARKLGANSLPGGRSITLRSTELLGGAAVIVPILMTLVLTVAVTGDHKALGLAGGAALLFVLGAIDDVRGVRARTKILVQILAGLCLVAAGFRLSAQGVVPGLEPYPLGIFEIPLLLFWVVLATNAFNLIDGMDGLATSIAALAAFTLAALGAMPLAALVVAGASIGFLRHNLPRASIFLGDCGSLVLGFLIAGLVLEAPTNANIPIAIGVMAYPLGDVTLAIVRRFLRGKPIFVGDRSHVHHKMMEHLGSAGKALGALVAFAAVPMGLVLLWPGLLSIALTILWWGGLVAVLIRLGQVRFDRLSSDRRPLQQLYVLRDYVERTLALSDDTKDVERALRHMAEPLSITSVSLPGFSLRMDGDTQGEQRYAVPLGTATAAWTAIPLSEDERGNLEDEREIVVTDLVRQAAVRVGQLNCTGKADRKRFRRGGLAVSYGPSPDSRPPDSRSPGSMSQS